MAIDLPKRPTGKRLEPITNPDFQGRTNLNGGTYLERIRDSFNNLRSALASAASNYDDFLIE